MEKPKLWLISETSRRGYDAIMGRGAEIQTGGNHSGMNGINMEVSYWRCHIVLSTQLVGETKWYFLKLGKSI